MITFLRRALISLVLLALIAGSAAWYWNRNQTEAPVYRTAAVTRGDITSTISATGTLEPEEVVDVGAQVAGQIVEFGKDDHGRLVDYGSPVEQDTVLARIDDTLYATDVAQATAQLELAKAGIERAEADLLQFQAKLDQATYEWQRAQKLQASNALAELEYTTYQNNLDAAKANVAVGRAAIAQAQATAAQAEATLKRARRNLGYCIIKSPVKGVIIDRRVNIGQTVVSSLNAPSLFLIAKDLRRIEVWVAANEADIGSIHPGQPVTFTVDAFPGQTFRGTVGKIRLNATMTQNVVTYTVEVITDNSDGRLLPYLTANVHFEVARRQDVLTVPNAALRYTPASQTPGPAGQPTGTQASRTRSAAASATAPSTGTLWALEGNHLQPLRVRIGQSDGTSSEVTGDNLREGLAVVTGEQASQTADSAGGTNPFAPQMRRNRPQPQRAP